MIFQLIPLFIFLILGGIGILPKLSSIGKYGALLGSIGLVYIYFMPDASCSISWFQVGDLDFNLFFEFSKTGILICCAISIVLSILYFSNHIELVDKKIKYKLPLLNIFVFFMCFTILSKNLFHYFIGMESIGIISTILVGLEQNSKKETTQVFMFNEFASLMFLIGIILIAIKTKSFDYDVIKSSVSKEFEIPSTFLLIGCVCKGALMPFSYWLLNAVKANIYASILIHAGTVVMIGILFVCKFHFLFESFHILCNIMTALGVLTAFWMGLCAIAQNNIKKIMACLTSASSGIMFVSCGMKAYHVAVLYIVSHLFFKTLLFLSFAYLISAMLGEKNIYKMGGLNCVTKKISNVLLISILSSIGFPFLSSFFSKISFMYAINTQGIGFIETTSSLLSIISTFAIFRLFAKTLYGSQHSDELTMSRAYNSNTWNLYPFWIMLVVSILITNYAWYLFEFGKLGFCEHQTIQHARTIFDYFEEFIIEISQVAFVIMAYIVYHKFSKSRFNFGANEFFVSLFQRNEIYRFICHTVSEFIIYIFGIINSFNNWISKIVRVNFFRILYKTEGVIESKHKRVISNHIAWIAIGMSTIMVIIFLMRF